MLRRRRCPHREAAGEAFWPYRGGQSSVQRYLKWRKRGKAIPSSSSLPPDAVPRGRSPSTPPTHPALAHGQASPFGPPQHVAALQHIVSICAQRGQTACFELAAFLPLINVSRCFHSCTSTLWLGFSLPPRLFLWLCVCLATGGFPFHVIGDQMFSRNLSACQTRGTTQQQLDCLSFSEALWAASKRSESRGQLCTPATGDNRGPV